MRQLKISKQFTNRESKSLDKYLNEISKVSMIDAQEEVELARRIREGDQVAHAIGRRMSDGIAETQARRAVIDGHLEKRREHLGTRAGRVLGHVSDLEARLDSDVDGLGAAPQDEVEIPILGELPNRARANERVNLDRHPGALRDLDHRQDVRRHRPPSKRDLDRQAVVAHLATHS